jgi:peptide/nickel transport system substrate-binding protein
MLHRARRLRLRRYMRMRQHQVVGIGEQTDKHFFRRFERLLRVRRFVAAWLTLMLLLCGISVAQFSALGGHYQTLKPAAGGMYTEGVIGTFTNANPIYASSLVDRTVSNLVFSSLMTFDNNNQLVGDLAEGWTSDARGQVYTVTLKPNAAWHDGQRVTSNDVVFTYQVIQNPDAQSPLNQSWQNVKVEAVDKQTVKFTLSNPLASFPYALTNGIIPKHILGKTPVAELRTSAFNTTQPIGSGPFVWQDVKVLGSVADSREELVMLESNKSYYRGKPKLDNFAVHAFRDEEHMLASYDDRELQAMVGLSQEPFNTKEDVQPISFPQTAAMMAFFKTTQPTFADKAVRQALAKAIDTRLVRQQLGYTAQAVNEPLLKNQLGYDKALQQFEYDIAGAKSLLQGAGYAAGQNSILQKAGQPLAFTITAEETAENARVAKILQQQWQKIGARVEVTLLAANELQVSLATHDYDILLRAISIGADPDVFAYWHSSQADITSSGRLNFSEYKSGAADEALGLARTRTDGALRAAKYKPFLNVWRDDAPAVGLYQPRFLYVTRQSVYGLEGHTVNTASDRLNNVHEWMIRRVKATVE